jgi:hypothetical protein
VLIRKRDVRYRLSAGRGKAKKYAGRLFLGRQQLLLTVRIIEGAASGCALVYSSGGAGDESRILISNCNAFLMSALGH